MRQADLTAMVPDELPPADRAELELVANLVSTGAATVYRFSLASLRRSGPRTPAAVPSRSRRTSPSEPPAASRSHWTT